jgi:4-azaleucine resistance transporter AzlC
MSAEDPRSRASSGERRELTRAAIGIGIYAAAFGITFGAISVGSGLDLAQTMLLSTVMFTGASQFALVATMSAGGSPFAAIPSALLIGVRNAFYGAPVARIVRPRGLRRIWTAHFVIDESTAMAVAQPTQTARRYAFWATGSILFGSWVAGSLTGAVIGRAVNPTALGLDAAAPAIFLALLVPQVKRSRSSRVAGAGALIAVLLIPVSQPGVPVIAAGAIAIACGLLERRTQPRIELTAVHSERQ